MQRIDYDDKWVLIVEDDLDHIALAERTMGKACAQLLTVACQTAEDALETLWINRDSLPFAVFVDLDLAGDSGLSLVRRMKQSEALCETKVIILTAAWDDSARTEAMLAGADGFVGKPLDVKRAMDFLVAENIGWQLSDLPQSLEEYRRRVKELPVR